MSAPQNVYPSIRGIAYPLQIENGNLAIKTDFDLKTQEIRSILETRFFERVMRADYGVNDYTLEILNPGQINSEFQTSIMDQVEGLSGLSVTGDWLSEGDNGVYKVIVNYSIDDIPQAPIEFALSN